MNATPAEVGSALGRAGFQSQRGVRWAHGFKASKFMTGTVAVTANFGTPEQERAALIEYAATLTVLGFRVEDEETTLFVS